MFQFLIELAERGTADERRSARGAIGGILDAVQQAVVAVGPEAAARHGYVVPSEIAAWLAAEQLKLAAGVDPKVALHLNVSKNRTTSYAQTKAALGAQNALQAAGMTWEEARAKVADELGISEDNLSQRITRLTGQTLP